MSRVPVIRELSWPAVIPQMIALGCAVAIGWFFVSTPNGIALGAAAYLAYSFGSRRLLLRDHRRGMRLVRNHNFEAAIPAFEKSYEFFRRYAWADRFRSVVMMSPSASSY